MSDKVVEPIELGAELAKILQDYGKQAIEESKKAIDEVADELVANLKADSPDSGQAHAKKYNKGWAKKVMFESTVEKRVTVWNKTAYQLTHLLEFGHAKRNGGRVAAQTHIAPNADKAESELVKRIEEAAKAK